MPKFKIRYSLQNCENEDWEIIEAKNRDEAIDVAYQGCIDEAESYGGLHGYPYYGTCKECEGSGMDSYNEEECEECEGAGEISWETFLENLDSYADYQAIEITKEEIENMC